MVQNSTTDKVQPQTATQYVKERLQTSLYSFINHESFGGVLLFLCVILALVFANSKYSDLYFGLLHTEFGGFIGGYFIRFSVLHFVNDALMSLFFLMIGLEMKREILYGELAGFKRISFSILGAFGGIAIPIIVYIYFNYGTESINGFGVAMSTDTAFALGVLLFLGKRIPRTIKIFLVTLAVFDDLGAILIIAFLYSSGVDFFWLYMAFFIICVLIYLNYRDTKYISLYILVGILLWIAVYNSGIHPTIAGVILAFCIPGRSNIRKKYFVNILNMLEDWNRAMSAEKKSTLYSKDEDKKGLFLGMYHGIVNFFISSENKRIDIQETSKQVHMLDTIAKYSRYAQNPLVKAEIFLHPICAYFIIPVFAFLNAGIVIDSTMNLNIDGIALGVILGLVVGKPLGIIIFTFIGERLNIAIRPTGLTYPHIFAVGILAGIGFTMSMFVANLAYQREEQIILAKLSILVASFIAIVLGLIVLIYATRKNRI